MKQYHCTEAPLQVFGIPYFEKTKVFERLPAEVRAQVPTLETLGRRCPGARVGFRTDASEFTVKVSLKTMSVDIGISIYGCQAVNVMAGDRQNAVYLGNVCPPDYSTLTFEKTFKKKAVMEDVTLWLPRNEEIDDIVVTLPDGAAVEAPTPYKHGPALYYGSSITEGGCCCMVTNAYTALLSRWLDLDFYNLGFSGSARGELPIADYIGDIPMEVFVYDYDHNADNVEVLARTHETFFKRFREKQPTTPVLMLTLPNFDYMEDAAERREIIRRTYENARAAGDENVYFIDGETFFGTEDRHLCTVDTIHPNDLGFYRMAKTILPVMEEILTK